MKLKGFLIVLACTALVGASGYGLYGFGMQRGMQMGAMTAGESATPSAGASSASGAAPGAAADIEALSIAQGEEATRRHISTGVKAGDVDPANGKKVLYYHDPMVPGNKFDKPAKSPFMDMMLVPVYSDSGADASKVTVSPRIQQNLGVRTALAVQGRLAPQVSAVGSIAYNERDQAIVQARATGYLERLKVRATLDAVKRGQVLAELYVPDWIAAQEEFLAVRRMQGADLAPLVDAARQRMRQVGMEETQIIQVERSGRTQPRFLMLAPISGVITELMAREGMTVTSGATLFRINGLSSVWANAEVPESQSAPLRPGNKVQATSPAVPGVRFDGQVQAILPEVNPATRTLKVRLELANPEGRLVPGMSVQMLFSETNTAMSVLVPSEAIIQTGKRALVILADDARRFRPVEVEVGIESDGQTEIRRGVSVGQRVVVSSQFLIDSEASLKGIEARLNAEPSPPAPADETKPESSSVQGAKP